jgi:hypothetical protein
MGVSDEAKNVIPLKFLGKIKNKIFFPLVNSIRGHTVESGLRKVITYCLEVFDRLFFSTHSLVSISFVSSEY